VLSASVALEELSEPQTAARLGDVRQQLAAESSLLGASAVGETKKIGSKVSVSTPVGSQTASNRPAPRRQELEIQIHDRMTEANLDPSVSAIGALKIR